MYNLSICSVIHGLYQEEVVTCASLVFLTTTVETATKSLTRSSRHLEYFFSKINSFLLTGLCMRVDVPSLGQTPAQPVSA